MPPSIFSSGRPLYRFASITQMPAGVMAMWSMLAFVPGMRRSCRTATDSETSESSRAPRRSSPIAPVAHAFVLCFSSDSATAMPPSFPHFWRSRSSSLALRRSYSRRADDPATPTSSGGASTAGRLDLRHVRDALHLGRALDAAHGLRRPLVDGFGPCWQLRPAAVGRPRRSGASSASLDCRRGRRRDSGQAYGHTIDEGGQRRGPSQEDANLGLRRLTASRAQAR